MDYDKLASPAAVKKTAAVLRKKRYNVNVFKTGSDALSAIKKAIPDGASVMNGASVTLEQIGHLDYLASGKHKWVDLHAKVASENDREKRAKLRREAVLSDYYLGSVHAVTQEGDFIVASNTGSQLPHIVFTSKNLIFVVSTKKIVKNLDEAMKRLIKHAYPLEDKKLMEKYNIHTGVSKIITFKGESAFSDRTISFFLVEQNLGY
jgi:L-lactate utilization protein LutC